MGCDPPSPSPLAHTVLTSTLYNIQQHTFADCLFARRFNAERYLCILSRTGAFGIGRRTFLEYNAFKGSNFGDMKSKAPNSSSLSEAMLLTTDQVPFTIIATNTSIYPTRPTAGVVVLELSACYVLRQLSSDWNWIVTELMRSFYDDIPFFFSYLSCL